MAGWYNGFSPEQRGRASVWFKQHQHEHKRTAAAYCDGCTQTDGVLMLHSEDYGEPFGPHLGEFTLCYRCHMMVHCRKHDDGRFRQYAGLVRSGHVWPPMFSRNWAQFKREMLQPSPATWEPERLNMNGPDVLQRIAAGEYNPNAPAYNGVGFPSGRKRQEPAG